MSRKTDLAGNLVYVLALLFIAFVGGAVVMTAKLPPAKLIADAYEAATAQWEKLTAYTNIFHTNFWNPPRSEARGVSIYDPARAMPGYTLYSSASGPYAQLITLEGEVVYEWRRPYSTVWQEGAAVDEPVADEYVFMREARLYPNGDLLALYIAAGDSPYGYGLVKLNADSEILWRYLEHTHHDVDIGPDGRIYTLTMAFKTKPIPNMEGLESPYSDEAVVILSPAGEELKRIPLISALARSKYEELLTRQTIHLYNPLHTNGIEVITATNQDNFPFGEPGDILLSFRNINTVAVLDPESEEIIWATHGYWLQQHDADLLANGDILLFDNYGHFEDHNYSRVVQFDPETMQRTWVYHGSEAHPMYSEIRSSAQRLPNGNTLITVSNAGRLVEVTPGGDIVWEYWNPVRGGPQDMDGNGERFIPIISSALRIDPATLTPEFKARLDTDNARQASAAAMR